MCSGGRGALGAGPRAGGGMEELSSVGEQVFAAECILSKRLRKVRATPPAAAWPALASGSPPALLSPQGKLEYLVKWRGWSSK